MSDRSGLKFKERRAKVREGQIFGDLHLLEVETGMELAA
jgi:hypothetical protein